MKYVYDTNRRLPVRIADRGQPRPRRAIVAGCGFFTALLVLWLPSRSAAAPDQDCDGYSREGAKCQCFPQNVARYLCDLLELGAERCSEAHSQVDALSYLCNQRGCIDFIDNVIDEFCGVHLTEDECSVLRANLDSSY